MTKWILLLSLLLITACSNHIEKKEYRRIMLGQVTQGNGVSKAEISDTKADAAFALAMKLTDRFGFIDKFTRDSIAQTLIDSNLSPKLIDIAELSRCDELAFLRIDRFNSILRVELQLVNAKDTTKKSKGEGFAFLNYRDKGSDKALFDPSLLTAVQRAFAVAIGDSNLFVHLGGNIGVKPAPTMIIAGISFEAAPDMRTWNLMDKKTVSSYTAIEAAFNAAKDSPNYVTYDIDTRDSIYKLFNLFLVENYSMPSLPEIDALRKFDIGYYIAGSYYQEQEEAKLSLSLFHITANNIIKVKSVQDILYKDDLVQFTELVEKMTHKLLK